jgi:hypothetical protein
VVCLDVFVRFGDRTGHFSFSLSLLSLSLSLPWHGTPQLNVEKCYSVIQRYVLQSLTIVIEFWHEVYHKSHIILLSWLVSHISFDFCGMAGSHQFWTYHPLIAITLWRRSVIWFITLLSIKVSESRGIRVEQDYEHGQHGSRRMSKVVLSSKSIFSLLFWVFWSKICLNETTIFPVFLILPPYRKPWKYIFFTRSVASQQ